MSLELILENLDGIDESIKPLYQQGEDGKFRLQVNGIEDTTGLKTALEKERKAKREAEAAKAQLEKQYGAIDLDQYNALMSKFENDEDAKLIAAGKIDEVVSKRTERMQKDHEKTIKSLQEERDAALKRAMAFEGKVFENGIREIAGKAGIIPTATEDVILRAKGTFKLGDDGLLLAVNADGQPIYGKDGKSGLTVSEWFESQKEAAPHWFPAVGGFGVKGGGGTSRIPSSLAECKTEAEEIEYLKHAKKE